MQVAECKIAERQSWVANDEKEAAPDWSLRQSQTGRFCYKLSAPDFTTRRKGTRTLITFLELPTNSNLISMRDHSVGVATFGFFFLHRKF